MSFIAMLRKNVLLRGLCHALHIGDMKRWWFFHSHKDIANFRSYIISQIHINIAKFEKEIIGNPALYDKRYQDILGAYDQFLMSPEEYYMLDFANKGLQERSLYISDFEMHRLLMGYNGGGVNTESELMDKVAFCKKMNSYIGRAITEVTSAKDFEQFKVFARGHKQLFCKPNYECKGVGIFYQEINNEQSIVDCFNKMIEAGGRWIVEEKIIQTRKMAVWNTSCVNTIRYYSMMDRKGNYNVLPHCLRTGRKGSIVDNAGSGGVFAAIDPSTGIVITDGVDEMGRYYNSHPDSKVRFKGWQVPRWEELCHLVESAHRKMLPRHRYIGWDWALTENGWVLIEANWGQFLNQYVEKTGRRKEWLECTGLHDYKFNHKRLKAHAL